VAASWYYSVGDGETNGPLSLDELANMAESGSLSRSHVVFHSVETHGKWVRAERIKKILNVFETQSPLPVDGPPPVDHSVNLEEVVVADRPRKPTVTVNTWLERFAGVHPAKIAMLILTASFICCFVVTFALFFIDRMSDAQVLSDGRYALGYSVYTFNRLILACGIYSFALATGWIPIYLFLLVICFVAWFATKPDSPSEAVTRGR
jgi:hypothetical protein